MADVPDDKIESAVLRANASFYHAFNAGDHAAMSALWAVEAPIACIHPGMRVVIGRKAVLESWRQILLESKGFHMRCHHARAHVLGEAALVTCYEGNGDQPPHLVATNAFVLEQGSWRMVHHQAGPLARAVPSNASERERSN